MGVPTSDERMNDLEMKFSFQEAQIEELQQTVHEQYLAFQKLTVEIKHLKDQLKSADEGPNTSHEKPPHY